MKLKVELEGVEVLVAVLDVDLEGSGCGVGAVVFEGDLSCGELSACEGGSGAAVDEDRAVGQRGDGEGDPSGVIV